MVMKEKLRDIARKAIYPQNSHSTQHFTIFWCSLLLPASLLFRRAVALRHLFYSSGLLPRHTLPLPVISVGNFTLGGNGKTPMAEFIARLFLHSSVPPLLLTRGYAGGDESRMLSRHLLHTSARIGVGANRTAAALRLLSIHGNGEIGVVILDDGMQHLSLRRDLDVLMVNGLSPWGNSRFLPAGPLREDPLSALRRSDVVVVHHADLAPEKHMVEIRRRIRQTGKCIPFFSSRMAASHFFRVGGDESRRVSLDAVTGRGVMCVSAIGCCDSFVMVVEKLGGSCTDRIDFTDHHRFQRRDMDMIRARVEDMQGRIGSGSDGVVVVVTEKDYDRDPEVFQLLQPLEVLVLCCDLQIMSCNDNGKEEDGDGFRRILLGILPSSSSP